MATINSGASPVDPTTDVGKVRILLGDSDAVNVTAGQGEYLYFSDLELAAFLSLYGDNPKLAAARALETIAASQALLLKSWSTEDLKVNGNVIAEALRKIALQLREEALAEGALAEHFEIISMPVPEHYELAERPAWYDR